MQTSTYPIDSRLSSKYQTVVPGKIRRALGVEKGDELIWNLKRAGDKVVAEVSPKPKSWANYMKGLGKKTWKDTDVDQYINKLRDDWDKK